MVHPGLLKVTVGRDKEVHRKTEMIGASCVDVPNEPWDMAI